MSYSTPSQVVARQLEYFEGKNLLIAGELEDTFATELCEVAASVSVFTTNLAFANKMDTFSQVTTYFGAEFPANKTIDMVLLYWPKAKAEAQYLLAMLMARCAENCEICVVGENRSGVKSIEKLFTDYGKVTKFDTARRCSFYWGQCTETPKPFSINDWFKSYPLEFGDTSLTIRALPGVFSQNELDVGSKLLLDNLPPLKGKTLDFGCGAGVIGAVIKSRYPEASVTMVDISALAVESAKETFRFNDLNGDVVASDVYSKVTEKYDNIISNPPFHAGLKTYYAATETFIKKAPSKLTHRGKLMIVANSFLRYPPLIEEAFGTCEVLDKTSKFAIYSADKH
ncbi:16S rRNA (guanine(1207)-N(2))-methyltransferase RsmC [Veronia nyctiphanis]|uniref:Ribosomal RNA small subunit methyltransferase C n=1 Tax=Veronia nyctiphanis TaxID=1278244 RepID=A0A4Q0YRF0_9GAMM|nr:16S rRNA (guanine(1207)-N(2))-methyltransferase RsmC [Veronia nyctiphanis]RXJ73750.1 16S rRNA (guanine(1207)-N(2))-methyltransferase RsmC [Veronia nyctiphanis]